MAKFYFQFLTILFSFNAISQDLSPTRVEKFKNATVKVNVIPDSAFNNTSAGTGFFIDDKGTILTCWHVIQPAIHNPSTQQKQLYIQPIEVTNRSGLRSRYFIPIHFFAPEMNSQAVGNDFVLLLPESLPSSATESLQLGNFNEIPEGAEVFTVGYPLGINQQFITKGTISTKFIDSGIVYANETTKIERKMHKSVALMDITLNKGNSGGPIIRLGSIEQHDRVIAIANFQITPFGQIAEEALTTINAQAKDNIVLDNISLKKLFKLIISALGSTTNGIGGAVSINHVWDSLK